MTLYHYSAPPMLTIYPIPILTSNYAWCIAYQGDAWVVDPGDHAPVLKFLARRNLKLRGILITHHHWDHISGVQSLLWSYSDSTVPVLGPAVQGSSPVTRPLQDGERLPLAGTEFNVIATPGHTPDHLSYWSAEKSILFCGDTLFSCGCGRTKDGSSEQLWASLSTLAELPADTQVYCTHEYTLKNIQFAQKVEPSNLALDEYARQCQTLRDNRQPTLPTTIGKERMLNPFLRLTEQQIIDLSSEYADKLLVSPLEVFTVLRKWKDQTLS